MIKPPDWGLFLCLGMWQVAYKSLKLPSGYSITKDIKARAGGVR